MFDTLKKCDWKTFFWNRLQTLVIVICLAIGGGVAFLALEAVIFLVIHFPTTAMVLFFAGIILAVAETIRKDLD